MKENKNVTEKEINYIPLVENYYYGADQIQYVLYKKVRKEKCEWKTRKPLGEYYDAYDICGYYTSLSGLINSCVTYLNRQSIEEGKIKTLKDCVTEIKNTYQTLIDIIEP